MGVYIKGMEMPTERESFNLTIKYNGTVLDTETGMQVAEAHELPPHGRLGDLDEIVRYKERLVVDADKINPKIRYVVDTKYIDTAPTIIQSSGGKEDE